MKKRFSSISILLGAIAVVALLGAGCQKYPSSRGADRDSGKKASLPFSKEETPRAREADSNDAYEAAIDLELPDSSSKAIERDLRSVVQPVFGRAKISSFLNNFPGENSLTVEYTTKKPTEQGSLNALLSILKDKGYVIDASGITEGNAMVSANSGGKSLIFTFQLNGQKVSVSFASQN